MPNRAGFSTRAQHAQRGVVLITGLIFMLILTLIVLALMRTGMLEERMASNLRNQAVALQAGEALLRDAEATYVSALAAPFEPFTPSSFSADCTTVAGLCAKPALGSTPRWKTIDWTSAAVTRVSTNASLITPALVASQPRYIVEVLTTPVITGGGAPCPIIVYRITARAMGLDSTEVFVQSMYRTLPNKC